MTYYETKPGATACRAWFPLLLGQDFLLQAQPNRASVELHFSMGPSDSESDISVKVWDVFPANRDLADNPTRACLAFHVLLPAVISFSGAKTITFSNKRRRA